MNSDILDRIMVPKFSYYRGLSAGQKRIYDKSDAIKSLPLPQIDRFRVVAQDLKKALEADEKLATQTATSRLISGLCTVYDVPKIRTKVLAKRPSKRGGELHGLYVAEEGKATVITVWMQTAKRKQVVAYKTFLRTVLHEFIHHLDFERFKLRDSFHTEGFYKRESSLLKQILEL